MNIVLVTHAHSPRQALMHGFWKGMAAPLMLFGANRAHLPAMAELPPLPKIEPIQPPQRLRTMTDLERIGADFWTVVRRYEQENAQHPTDADQGD